MGAYVLGAIFFWGAIAGAFGLFEGDGSDEGPGEGPGPDEETIHGGTGDDLLSGSGNQVIEGWGGDDRVTLSDHASGYGGQGNDHITADNYNSAYGGAGNDTLEGAANTAAHGGGDDDDLVVSSGGTAYGDAGDDLLGGNPADVQSFEKFLYGGDGADTIYGSTDDRKLDGDAGDDLVVIGAGLTANSLGVHVDVGAGNDVVFLDPDAVVVSDDAFGSNSVTIGQMGAGDQVVLGDANPSALAQMTWVQGPDGSFTLYNAGLATNLRVYTEDGSMPDAPEGAAWEISQQPTLRDYQPDIAGTDGEGVGTEGNDVLSADLSDAYGLGGDDTMTGNMGGYIYGGDGDDLVYSFGAAAFGGAGDDSMSGFADLFGGDGDDLLTADRLGGEGTDDVRDVDGGAGNDTIMAATTSHDGGTFSGGEGDDVISFGLRSEGNGGAGDDLLIVHGGGDGAESHFTASALGGSGTDAFVVDMTLMGDGAAVILGDYEAGEEIVLAIDPADVVSADWAASSDTSPGHDFHLYTLSVHLTDGSTFMIQIPRDASNYDPGSLADIPLSFDPALPADLAA